jgi:hypothetical protein
MRVSVMLSLPTKLFRSNAAFALAALYGFCVLAPSLAFAFFDNPAVPFCLTESYLNPMLYSGAPHTHDDGDAPHHADHSAPHEHAASHEHATVQEHSAPHHHPDHGANGNSTDCCGLFPMVGLFGEARFAFGPSNLVSVPFPALTDALQGRGSERINKPPIG